MSASSKNSKGVSRTTSNLSKSSKRTEEVEIDETSLEGRRRSTRNVSQSSQTKSTTSCNANEEVNVTSSRQPIDVTSIIAELKDLSGIAAMDVPQYIKDYILNEPTALIPWTLDCRDAEECPLAPSVRNCGDPYRRLLSLIPLNNWPNDWPMYAESDKVSKEAIVLANTCVAIISELLVVYKYDPPILPKDRCPRVYKNAAHILILQCLEKKSAAFIGLWRLSNQLDAAITMYEDMMTPPPPMPTTLITAR